MKTTINDGGPAFPVQPIQTGERQFDHPGAYLADVCGMTLRDYFAAKALPTLQSQMMVHVLDDKVMPEEAFQVIAEDAYELADAMLKAREQSQP